VSQREIVIRRAEPTENDSVQRWRDSRGTGVGAKLLVHAEREIRSRGHGTLRLRVVMSNTPAVEFYQSHGWSVHREFPHEKFGHMMFEMTKSSEMRLVS
jgi:GNAT superfamily N-acetyltransferase